MKQTCIRILFALMALLTFSSVHAAKKVHTLGDSTMAFYDEDATNTRGWGMYFGNFLTNGWTSINYAKGGRDSRGGFNELWNNAKNNVEEGDYVLIQFAHNDGKYNGVDNLELQDYYTKAGDAAQATAVKNDGRGTTPSTTYKACLKQIIDAVKEKGATPVLVSAVCRCYFTNGVAPITRVGRHDLGDKYDAIVDGVLLTGQKIAADDHTMDYGYQMQQLATEENVAFIDMTAATKKLYEDYETYDKCYAALFDKGAETDNTHYNLTGALTAARLCAQLMKDGGVLAENIEIPTDISFSPSSADMGDVYVGQSATKEMTLTGLGLDPSTGKITVSASEGIQLSFDKENWMEALEVDYESGTVVKTFYAKVAATAVGEFKGTVKATLGNKAVVADVTMNAIELGGGDPFTTTWALTSDDNAVVDGNATASVAKVEGMVKYGNDSQNGLMVSTSEGGAWVKAEDDSPNQYVEFTVTCPEGKKLDISSINMKIGGRGGGGMHCHAYYSTDGFVTRTTFYSPASMASGVMNEVAASPVVQLEEGDQFQIRVYPWYTGNATGKWLCVQDVVVEGQSKDAAGVNIEGTITYALDKGGLADNDDDAVMNPNELSAGFAGKKWAYDGTNDKVVIEGTTFQGATGDVKMMQLKYTGSSSETLSPTASDDCTVSLTLTPEDGFSFVPSKVSFIAGKFNSGNPHLTFAVEAGNAKQVLKDNVEINRSKTTPRVDPSEFSEEISGITATADAPLKLKFSFLNVQGTRSAGIGNLVIEGTLVGSAAQVTKYVLNTQVLPSAEAGSISRTPDMEQYKEGSNVTLKATKNFGYKFKEWQDETGAPVSTDAETVVTMDAEKTMKAVFEAVPVYTVKTKVTNDAERDLGSITLTPNDHNGQYEAGTKITATANELPILKFLSWTDENENHGASATRELTVNSDMTLVANYEVQDFIAVFNASKTAAYATAGSYPFAADITWDANRNAKVSIVKQSDGSKVIGTSNSAPVVRNRANSGVLTTLSGVFQNGYNTAEVAWQYQFSTKGFTTATFTADMAAKNAATKNWKAQICYDGKTFIDLNEAWSVTANVQTPLSFTLPEDAMGKDSVFVRIMGYGNELLSEKYAFDAGTSDEGLKYATNSESQIGNVFVLGDAQVEEDTQAPAVTATIPADNATGVSASGKITISFDERIETAGSDGAVTLVLKGGLGGQALTPTWNSRSVSFDYKNLDYDKTYSFNMPANYVQDKSGNKYAEAVVITFTTMARPVVDKADYDAVVSTAEELAAAIKTANTRSDQTTRYRIFIKKGTYKMPTGATKHYKHTKSDGSVTYWEGDLPDPITYVTGSNISFIGEDRDETIITQDITNDADMLFAGQFGTTHKYERIGESDVLQLTGSNIYMQDITVKSGIDDALGRNLAVHEKGNHNIYKNVKLWGYQDTWTSNADAGILYFEGGVVRGRTDYLCGKGDAYFNGVELLQIYGGYPIVPSISKTANAVGWVFKDCTINGTDGVAKYGETVYSADQVSGSFTLGRPWGNGTPTAYLIDTKMNVQPKAIGWDEMSGTNYPKRFAEYNSMNEYGAAIDLSGRKTDFGGQTNVNNPILTADEAAEYGDMSTMFGDWQPTLLTEQAPVPTNVVANAGTITWDDSSYALLWAVCKDGKVVAFTTAPSYVATEDGEYAVRAANEMGGLSAMSLAVTVSDVTGIKVSGGNDASAVVKGVFSIDGRQLQQLQQGINIVKMSDGTIKKIVKE